MIDGEPKHAGRWTGAEFEFRWRSGRSTRERVTYWKVYGSAHSPPQIWQIRVPSDIPTGFFDRVYMLPESVRVATFERREMWVTSWGRARPALTWYEEVA